MDTNNNRKLKDPTDTNWQQWLMIVFFVLVSVVNIIIYSTIIKEKNEQNQLNFYQNESVREAQIISIQDDNVYVIDTLKQKVIEIKLRDELKSSQYYTLVRVGNIAIYKVNYDYTEIELLWIFRKY